MVYNYSAGESKIKKLAIAQKLSLEFLKVDFELANLKKCDFDAVWDIAGKLFRLTSGRVQIEQAEDADTEDVE